MQFSCTEQERNSIGIHAFESPVISQWLAIFDPSHKKVPTTAGQQTRFRLFLIINQPFDYAVSTEKSGLRHQRWKVFHKRIMVLNKGALQDENDFS